MHQFTGKVIFILIVISFFFGAAVVSGLIPGSWIGLKHEYTLEYNIRSNRHYYPSVKVGAAPAATREDREEISSDKGY